MSRKKKCPLRAYLPIRASVIGRYDIVVGSDVGIAASDCPDNGHDDVVHDRVHDGAECNSDDHAYGEIRHVSAHYKFLEFLPHLLLRFVLDSALYRTRPQ